MACAVKLNTYVSTTSEKEKERKPSKQELLVVKDSTTSEKEGHKPKLTGAIRLIEEIPVDVQ